MSAWETLRRWYVRLEHAGDLRRMLGWGIMVASLGPVAFREGWIVPETRDAALVLAGIVLLFLFLLRPRLGSFYDVRGAISGLVVFSTCAAGFTHVLANRGDWTLARMYHSVQNSAAAALSDAVGSGAAEVAVSPLYLLLATTLLLSLAFRTLKGFQLFILLVLLYGLYPLRAEVVSGYLLWFAGYWLIVEEPLYLPARVEERVTFSRGGRDLLLELRHHPLPEEHALFLLCGRPVRSHRELDTGAMQELHQLAGSNLVEYDPASHMLRPTPALLGSDMPAGVAGIAETLSLLAGIVVLFVGILYFAMPFDLVPEGLVGPVGLLDDFVLLAFAALPAGRWLLDQWPVLLSRKRRT